MSKKKKEEKAFNYADSHNRAVKSYKRTSLFLMWGGIIGFVSTILGVFNIGSAANGELAINYRYSLTFALNRFIFNALEYSELNIVVTSLLILLISAASAGLVAILGYYAQLGRIRYLYIGMGVYLVDFIALFIYDNGFPTLFERTFNLSIYLFSLFFHIVILGAGVVAIVHYYRVLNIETRHQELLSKQEESK